jgi:hypothetical protein
MENLRTSPATVGVGTPEDAVVAGQSLEATVRVVADRPLTVVGGEVELVRTSAVPHGRRQWSGAGGTVGLRRSAVASRAELDVTGPLAAGQSLIRRIVLDVPPDEATIAGHLVQQDYAVRARIRADGDRSAEGTAPVRVASRADGRGWIAATAPVTDDAGCAALGIEDLTSRCPSGGVPVTGAVTVTPRQAGRARGVRIELVLEEHVPARAEEQVEEDRHARTVVAVVQLADDVDLEAGGQLRFPFTLRAPLPLPASSISTPEFTLRWLLRAVLDRPLRPDPVTTVELWGATAP